MRPTIILDTETTSLSPDYTTGGGVIWELAMIERDCGAERLWRMEPNVQRADPDSLKVGRFHERTAGMRHARDDEARRARGDIWELAGPMCAGPLWSSPADLAPHVAGLLDGATIVAANPAFDAGFLTAFLGAYGCEPQWHYRLRDIGSMAWGFLARAQSLYLGAIPAIDASTDDFARALGVDPERFDRHTALGDCRLAGTMLDVIAKGDL